MAERIDSRILLVDDEAGIRTVLGIALADSGYRVTTAENGEEALRLFRELKPPIVLTDIKMPEMDGIELLQHIKAESPDTEVIMFTGHGDMDLAIKSLKYDATDFVTKPINDEILDIALKRARERISLRRQLREHTENLERLVEEKSRDLIEAERMAAVGQTRQLPQGKHFRPGKRGRARREGVHPRGVADGGKQRGEDQESLPGSSALRQIRQGPAQSLRPEPPGG